MRILLVSKIVSSYGGGADKHVYQLARYLSKSHEVTVLTSDIMKEDIPRVTTIHLPVKFKYMYYIIVKGLYDYLNKNLRQFDLIHTHGYCCNLVDTVTQKAKKFGIPVISTIHSLTPSRNIFFKTIMDLYTNHIGKETLSIPTKLIAVSKTIQYQLISHKIPPDKIQLLYNAVDVPPKIKNKNNQLNTKIRQFKGKSKLLLYAGRVSEEKGNLFLIEAFDKLSKINKNIKLLIVGYEKTRYGQKVLDKINSYNLKQKIMVIGKVEHTNLGNVYAQSDVFVLPSKYESFGMAIIEAMSFGLLIAGSRVGGIKETLKKTKNALFDYNNKTEFVGAISKLLNLSNSARKKLTRDNKLHANNYQWKDYIKKIEKSYSNIAKKHSLRVAIVKPPWANLKTSFILLAKVYCHIAKRYNVEFTLFVDRRLAFQFPPLKTINIFSPDKWSHLYKFSLVLGIPYYYYPSLINRLAKYDVIETGSPEFYIYATQSCLAAKKYNSNLFLSQSQTHYGFLFPYTKFIALHFARKFVKKANTLFFTNNAAKNAYVNFGLIKNDSKKAEVIGHAIDTDIFKPIPIKKKINKIILLGVGGLFKIKGFDMMIKALSALVKRGYDIELWLVGEGKDKQYFVNLSKHLKISNRVQFLGFQDHNTLVKTYNLADIYLLCNTQEVTPTVSEALLCKTPVVAMQCGGLRDVIPNDYYGLVSKKGDTNEFINKIEILINNKRLCQTIAERGQKHILNNFSYRKVAEKIYKKYIS